jgi:hypothetical protein
MPGRPSIKTYIYMRKKGKCTISRRNSPRSTKATRILAYCLSRGKFPIFPTQKEEFGLPTSV